MRKRFGLAAAAVVSIAVASIGLAVAASSNHSRNTKLTIQPAMPGGSKASSVSSSHSSAVPTVQVARGTLTPAIRDMHPAPGRWNTIFNKRGERARAEGLKAADRHEGSALVQHSAPKNQMPSPIVNFLGVNNVNGVAPPDTEGDVGPNHYMQWVNLSFRIYNKDG